MKILDNTTVKIPRAVRDIKIVLFCLETIIFFMFYG